MEKNKGHGVKDMKGNEIIETIANEILLHGIILGIICTIVVAVL